MLTDGVTSIEGAAGGGLATWAVIAGHETDAGFGATAHVTRVVLPDFDLTSLVPQLACTTGSSYLGRIGGSTRAVGAALGFGHGFTFGQEVIGAELRITGDAVVA